MPFAAFCKKCKKVETLGNDTSFAYMIGPTLLDIKARVSEHFNKAHNCTPTPIPSTLSWNNDFREVEIELTQYGIGDRDMSHLTFIFTGPSVRQFDSDDYTISVITRYHYDECVRKLESKGRIDLELYEYF